MRGHGVIKQITEIIMVKKKEEKKSRRRRQNIFNNPVYTVAPKTLASAQTRGSTLVCILGNFSKVCNQNKSNKKNHQTASATTTTTVSRDSN